MPIDLKILGARLRDARVNCGISQEQAAEASGLPRTAIVHIESGQRAIGTLELDELARMYNRSVADFFADLAPDKEDVLALLRAAPEFADQAEVQKEINRHLSICAAGFELETLLGIQRRTILPEYALSAPQSVMEAVEQGGWVAAEERRRLSIGENPIPDMADLLTAQGIWASGAIMPDEISGLFLRHSSVGTVVLVNFGHIRARKRFSYAHEFCHALVDRSAVPKISSATNRQELREVRANAFAAAFLLPRGGVDSFLCSRDKGSPSRVEQVVYDPGAESGEQSVLAHRRVAPGSQRITFQDVATLAHFFGASYPAAAYRLKGLGRIGQDELENLLGQQEMGLQFLTILKMANDLGGKDDPENRDRELVSQVVSLAVEAYRREEIPKEKFLEISKTLGIPGKALLVFADAA
jgi:Predicted Zn peptidase